MVSAVAGGCAQQSAGFMHFNHGQRCLTTACRSGHFASYVSQSAATIPFASTGDPPAASLKLPGPPARPSARLRNQTHRINRVAKWRSKKAFAARTAAKAESAFEFTSRMQLTIVCTQTSSPALSSGFLLLNKFEQKTVWDKQPPSGYWPFPGGGKSVGEG